VKSCTAENSSGRERTLLEEHACQPGLPATGEKPIETDDIHGFELKAPRRPG
jgi:hypothetical protein